jgi:2-polyprenyl-3-methyl-5-hydroxy-6-metoxy-1,4-benzoquinol methylase
MTTDLSKIGERLSEKEIRPDEMMAGQEAAYARDVAKLQLRIPEFVEVPCPACGGTSYTPAFVKYKFSFQLCADCRTIYMSPRPSPAVMADYYLHSENYAYYATHIFPASEASRREKIHRPWLQRVADYCSRFDVPRGTLLEVGPGFGTFAELATKSKLFSRVVAIEPTPEMASACRARGIEVIEDSVENVISKMVSADVVVSFEVIEHLFDPHIFLSHCAALIPTGGLLVLTCPNGCGFEISMLGAKSVAVDSEHVNLFNPQSLSHLLARCGFTVLEATTPGRLDAELVRDVALKGEVPLDPFLRQVLLEDWQALGWPFQRFLAENSLSSHMWVVAQKR